jgi:hypothetical protein
MVLAAIALPFLACGDDPAADPTTSPSSTTGTSTSGPTTASGPTSGVPADTATVRSYFLRNEEVGPVARASADEGVGRSAVEGLLAGPTEAEAAIGFSTAVPAGTELLDLAIEDGIATVDLSGPFASGGGSASMQGRVAQVVFTLTQFPTVDGVRFELEGEALTELGGEGLMLEAPQTRDDWEDLSPAILVESPLPFEAVSSPLRISGTGNTFEASFQATVTDSAGRVVYQQPQTATSGTGTRGTFDITATLDTPAPGRGTILVFEDSAENGQPINRVEVPVDITG